MFKAIVLVLAALLGLTVEVASRDASPVCAIVSVQVLLANVPAADWFELAGPMLAGLGPLEIGAPASEAATPDGALVFSWQQWPLLVVLTHDDCVVGLFRVERQVLWDALLRGVGPAI